MKHSEKVCEFSSGLPAPSITILLAVDGSKYSRIAAQGLSELPLPVGSMVLVLTIAQEFKQVTRVEPYILLKERQAHEIKKTLRQAHISLSKGNFHIEKMILSGQAADIITRTATEFDVDLIVLGIRENAAKTTMSSGSTVQKIIQYAQQSVLVTRQPLRTQRILLVFDGSTMATKALDFLLQLPWPTELNVSVLHVSPAPLFPWVCSKKAQEEEKNATIRNQEQGQVIVNQTVERLRSAGLQADGQVAIRDATFQILKLAEEKGVDQILLSIKGRSTLMRLFLGNISRRVVHYAPCSVLVIPS